MSELQRLRDRVEELEDLLGMGDDDAVLIKLITRMPMMACKILGVIRKRRTVATRELIYGAVYGSRPDCDQPDTKIIDVQISHIRNKLKPLGLAVKTVWGVGYTMPDEDRTRLGLMMAEKLNPAEIPAFLPRATPCLATSV